MTFEEAVEKFRSQEQVEDVLAITNVKDPQAIRLRRLVVAWGKIKIDRISVQRPAPPAEDEKELWKWMWECVRYDPEELRQVSGVRVGVEMLMRVLIGNRIIYPDGTVSEYAKKVIRAILKNDIGA